MKIQVLGSGCATCKNLYELTKNVVLEMKLETEVEYITGSAGIEKIIELGAVTSPVLSVNGHIAMTGFVPNKEKIKEKIQKALAK